MLIAVDFPKEKWKKVNMSRFLSRFEKRTPSVLVKVPEDDAEHVIEVLNRNKCRTQILKPARRDFEGRAIKNLLAHVERVRMGSEEPGALGKFAVDKIAMLGLANLSDELADILHLSVEFEEDPSILLLNDIEKKAREFIV